MDLPAILYLVAFLLLIYQTKLQGLFADKEISAGKITVLFFLKCLAIPVFYIVYKKMYGSIEKFDAGIFYRDAKALNDLAWVNFAEFIKMLFGLQDDSPGSYFYNHGMINTQNWDNGKLEDFFYNDNRIVIRLHSILHFLAFGSYWVHAIFNCLLSYIGIFFLYKSFKEFFIGKEIGLLLILCLFPTLWFYTGTVSKEGLAIFVLGCAVYQVKKILQKDFKIINLAWLIFLLFICVLLKPYLLCSAILYFALFFFLQHLINSRYKSVSFYFVIVLVLISVNFAFVLFKNKSLIDIVAAQRHIFSNASQGGIFLADKVKHVRLTDDTTQISKIPGTNTYRIKTDVTYMYWEHSRPNDTLFCKINKDTTSQYYLVSRVTKGGSNIDLEQYSKHSLSAALVYSLLYPLFYNARGPLQLLASIENLSIIISLTVILYGLLKNKRDRFLPLAFLCFAISLCLLIGLSTPNSGAIFRYRSPVVVFILLSALYYVGPAKTDFFKSGINSTL